MALERGTFAFGGATFPLGAATGNSLLEDVDPALYHTLEFMASVLQTHLGERWDEAATAAGLASVAAAIVQTKLPNNPEDYLTETQVKLPLLAVYRDSSEFGDQTNIYGWGIARWRAEFVLPPITFAQAEQLQPILNGVVAVIVDRIQEGSDPAYNADARVWVSAGLDQIAVKRATFGKYPGVQGLTCPAVQIELEVYEQQSRPAGAFDAITSTGTTVDLADDDSVTIATFAEIEAPAEPVPDP